ncbi:hypothetical protein ES703_71806 [subsurface metagenome]
MDVKLALLADYVNMTPEGKLNLMGLFTVINAPTLPWSHPQMQLVLQMEADPAEWGKQKKIEIILMDQDANTILTIGSELTVPKGKSGKPVQINTILNFHNVTFKTAGDYAFVILIGGETKERIPLRVNHSPPTPPTKS